jgi:hypothetical protein
VVHRDVPAPDRTGVRGGGAIGKGSKPRGRRGIDRAQMTGTNGATAQRFDPIRHRTSQTLSLEIAKPIPAF